MGADKIQIIEGRALPLRGDDMDTDRIMPARFLKSITFEGLDAHVFEDDRLETKRSWRIHPFDEPKYQGASSLVAATSAPGRRVNMRRRVCAAGESAPSSPNRSQRFSLATR